MHYVWQQRLFSALQLTTVDGIPVIVLDPGRHNTDAGPDFFNAKVKIGDRLWAGDIEIHVCASDWHRHHHDGDRAYDSVILHVVRFDDTMIHRSNGETIPQLVLKVNPELNAEFHRLIDMSRSELPCATRLQTIGTLHTSGWIDALAFERIYSKSERIMELLERSAGDWEEAAYVILARSLGFGLNNDPMERLARSLPLKWIRRHSDSLTTIEALLLGQSGLLTQQNIAGDPYIANIVNEYRFYAHKYNLKPLDSPGWKLSRTRPANLPFRRIALLAALCAGGFSLMSSILASDSSEEKLSSIFETSLSPYWSRHYTPGGAASTFELPTLGRSSLRILLINVVAPLLMAYGTAHDDSTATDRAVSLLQSLPPENNRLVSMFTDAGLKCRDAFTSQAFIQLRRAYCEQNKCLFCRLGHRLLSEKAVLYNS